jgi:hypothetical protein
VVDCKKSIECDSFRAKNEFDFEQWQSRSGSCCNKCRGEDSVKLRKMKEVLSRRSDRNKGRDVSYNGPRDEGMLGKDAEDVAKTWSQWTGPGVRCETAEDCRQVWECMYLCLCTVDVHAQCRHQLKSVHHTVTRTHPHIFSHTAAHSRLDVNESGWGRRCWHSYGD